MASSSHPTRFRGWLRRMTAPVSGKTRMMTTNPISPTPSESELWFAAGRATEMAAVSSRASGITRDHRRSASSDNGILALVRSASQTWLVSAS